MITGSLGHPGEDGGLAARFALEVRPLLASLMRQSRRLTKSHADAEDLLQDALLHAYKGFHTFTEGTNLSAWLFRILHNRWASAYRRSLSRPTELADELMAGWGADRSVAVASAESEALSKLTDSVLKEAFSSLPQGIQEVLYYANMYGYTYAETAAIMNIPHGTVMSRAARGRQKLRELMKSREDQGA
ncbi:hypothetical protein A5717_21350 [Mycolicibacterium porcinum]|uniref:sigma-70 family RNA polymerase sigma factor n=1 Tax=Mycolicibacterium porcinum TaxID=39693 RepID=UPI00080B740D|nr:sigma-70 family RNA polymerase sigma factor [Mycolicibacterium porcinum]OCB11065.1 hypothetical protein A5717_21350 [Mycolicibacterium porcinum]